MGPSGSGKSTLMHCMAGLDALSSGQAWIGDTELSGLDDKRLTTLRRDKIGFVFQAFNLLPTLTRTGEHHAADGHRRPQADQEWLDRVVDAVGLRPRLGHRPSELSGGQQQRVACAAGPGEPARHRLRRRAHGQPRLPQRRGRLGFLRMSVRELGQTVVMVTHDPAAASYSDRVCSSPTAASSTR
jgi:putative ABC transport system ATP-binding protein